jgi:two-component system phosphate regulon sensor histidine kinase PhoR
MNRKVLTIIIILTSVSLIAALVTQLLWVRDAGLLKEDQFNNNVRVALKSVVNQLMATNTEYSHKTANVDSTFFSEHADLLSVVHPRALDSLIADEIESLNIESKVYYAIYHETDKLFIMGNGKEKLSQLMASPLQVSLTCLCQSDNYVLSAYIPDQGSVLLNQMIILPVMSGLFLLVLVFSFFFTIYFIVRQKKLTDMKSDFVNNLTHEFKTPISTISVTSEILGQEQVISSPEKVSKYAQIIYEENQRLKNMVERVLQIAIIDKDDFKPRMEEVDVHEIIPICAKNYKLLVTQRNGYLRLKMEAHRSAIIADREHMANILNNLLDNANKYSPEKPIINVSTLNNNGLVQIIIQDNGIGISKDNLEKVFKKFHRLQRGDIHDVKGFGIGLFYVKTMVEKMGGRIELKSELNKGSRFILSFPATIH